MPTPILRKKMGSPLPNPTDPFFSVIKLLWSARLKYAIQMKCLKSVLSTEQPLPGLGKTRTTTKYI